MHLQEKLKVDSFKYLEVNQNKMIGQSYDTQSSGKQVSCRKGNPEIVYMKE